MSDEVVTQFQGHDLEEFVVLCLKPFFWALQKEPIADVLSDPVTAAQRQVPHVGFPTP